MKIYFLSAIPAVLKVGGAYFGVVGDFEKFAEISLRDGLFVECIPQGALPVGFFLNEDLPDAPPQGVEIYLLKDGMAVFIREYPPSDLTLRPISGKRFGSTLVTLFKQGKLQAAIESEKGVFVTPLPDGFEDSEIDRWGNFLLLQTKNRLAVLSDEGKLLLTRETVQCTLSGEELTVLSPLHDSLNRLSKEVFSAGKELTRTQYSLLAPQAAERAEDALVPYAFFESVLIGADLSPFLSPELLENAERIKEFLGDFSAVTLTPDLQTVGLVKQKRERVFELTYYTVELQNGKIVDIKG